MGPSFNCGRAMSAAKTERPVSAAPEGGREVSRKVSRSAALPFMRWVYETYHDQQRLSQLDGSKKFKRFITSADIETFPLSGARRVQSFHIIKFGYPMRRAGYLTAAFVVRVREASPDTLLEACTPHEAYYAYAYWPRDLEKDISAEELPEYLCLSPTFTSSDGEYRHSFLWFKQFQEGYEALAEKLGPIESLVLEEIQKCEIAIEQMFYPNDPVLNYVESRQRVGLKALVATLAVNAVRAREKTLQAHASAGYVRVMEVLYARCKNVFKSWSDADRAEMSVFETGMPDQPHRTQCGQKLIPLTIHEALWVGNINFGPWREMWVNEKVTELVVNSVAPMFSIFNNWAFLNGTNPTLFENRKILHRFGRSRLTENVAELVREARVVIRQSRAAETDPGMGQLDAILFQAAKYAQDSLLLTDLAVCATGEHVGNTIGSVPEIVSRSRTVSPAFDRMFKNPAMQARYLFDLCYGAHVLHTRVGAIHSDLHLNNMTLYELSNQFQGTAAADGITYAPRYANPLIAYVAGPRGEADTYVFPHDGWFACLIDFSRAILGPGTRTAIVAESGESFATTFYRSQFSRILRVLEHYVPDLYQTHQEKIKGALFGDFDTFFRVLTAIDFMAIGRNYGALLKKAPLEVNPVGIETAREIERRAAAHLADSLARLVEGPKDGDRIPHAGDIVIPSVFGGYRYPAWESRSAPAGIRLSRATLVDVYNSKAPLDYSGSDPARFPPWANLDVLTRHLGEIKIGVVTSGRGDRPFLESRNPSEYLSVLQAQIRQKRDKDEESRIDAPPWVL